MFRTVVIILTFVFVTGCGTSTRSQATKRSLMLVDVHELPRNAKLSSPKYQQGLKKTAKKYYRENKKRYKRSGR